MKKPWLAVSAVAIASAIGAGAYFKQSEASDHDDGERDIKSRALNLTDHFAFKSGDDLVLIMYVNPRSLPGRQYTLSTNARYEFHVTKVASRTAKPVPQNDYVFRFEAKDPDAAGVQDITLTVFKDGSRSGAPVIGKSTSFLASKANEAANLTVNTGDAGGIGVKWFVGMRADSFYFDVNRFFQVRAFLASRFFGGAGGNGNATATLAANCEGDAFLQGIGGVDPDGDVINLFNPPSCAPDFTKNLNVTAIVLNVPLDALDSTVFDTWSTISVKQ